MASIQWASDAQRDAWNYGPMPLCLSGGFGAGKTWLGCTKGLYLSDRYPKNRGVIARRVGTELRATTMPTFFKVCPPSAYDKGSRNDQMRHLRMNNGSEILWLHLDDPDTEGIIKGLEINWFFIDQAEECREEIYDRLVSRLGRWDQTEVPNVGDDWPWRNQDGRPVPPTYPMIACNPDHELHWIYKRFHPDSLEHHDRYQALGYKMIELPSLENRFLSDQAKAHLLSQDESFRHRYVFAKWGAPEASIHTPSPLSLLDPLPGLLDYLQHACTWHRTMDHGDAAPTCCLWWATDGHGRAFCVREYYQPGKLISEHRTAITEMSGYETYTFNLADPSIFYLTQQKYGGRWSVADEYADRIHLPDQTALDWEAGDNNELGTRNRINEYLRIDPEMTHPVTGEKGAPHLYFVQQADGYPDGCRHAIQQLKTQRRIKLGTELGRPIYSDDRDPRVTDHAYDCLAGDTRVQTRDGERDITTLVGTTGEVWTVAGWQPYTDCRRYRHDAPMVTITAGPVSFRCTPDHLILTTAGWREAIFLTTDDIIATCNQWSFLPRFKSLPARAITSVGRIFNGMVSACIAWYGQTRTERFPTSTTSIIEMGTDTTTEWRTWNFSPPLNTSVATQKVSRTPQPWPRCKPPQKTGTGATPDAPGTETTRISQSEKRGSGMWRNAARRVGQTICRRGAQRLGVDTAHRIARWLGFGNVTRVTQISTTAPADAYCLRVPDPHAFAINGGILVHNCIRYFIASRPPLSVAPPEAAGPNTFWAKREQIKQASLKRKGRLRFASQR